MRMLVAADLRAHKRGSLEDLLIALVTELQRADIEVDVLFSQSPIAAVREALAATGATVGALPFRNQAAALRQLVVRLRERRYDVVHFHFVRAFDPLVAAARLGGAVVVTTEHFVLRSPLPDVTAPSARDWLARRARSLAVRLVHRRVAVSDAVAASIAAAEGVPRERIMVIRNGVDLSRFRPRAYADRRVREELGASGPLVLYVGRLALEKGPDLVLDAAAALPQRAERPHVVFLGEGPEREALIARARKLGIAARVSFVGVRSDTEDFYAAASVVVVPSRVPDACPIVVLEGQAAAVPVVATAVGGIGELLRYGEGGLVVPSGDVEALAGAIDAILRDPHLAAQLGSEGRRQVEQRFSCQRWCDDHLALYAGLGLRPRLPIASPAAVAGSRSASG